MVGNCAARLVQNLDQPPGWLEGFAGYLAVRLSPGRAVTLLHQLAGVLASSSNVPAAVLAAAGQPLNQAAPPAQRSPGRWRPSSPVPGSPCRPTPPPRPLRPAAVGASMRHRKRSAQPPPASATPSCS
jgi:hypothetical protein